MVINRRRPRRALHRAPFYRRGRPTPVRRGWTPGHHPRRIVPTMIMRVRPRMPRRRYRYAFRTGGRVLINARQRIAYRAGRRAAIRAMRRSYR